MATLITGYNPQYSENASILTGNPDRVTVEVEDNIDEAFWKDLLKELCPQKDFHFDPYHTILNVDGSKKVITGKARIIVGAKDFNNWHIGCVDSDYDWLLSDYTDDGKAINSNKYLLQTYAYSIENLMCLPTTLTDFCREVTEEDAEFDFVDYVSKLSRIIYPLLVWSVYLYSKGNHDFTPTAWRQIMVSEMKDEQQSLAIIEHRGKAKLDELNEKYASEISDKEALVKKLSEEKMMTMENSHLFVRGHELFDLLANVVLSGIIPSLRQHHFGALRIADTENIERVAALQEYSKKNTSVGDKLKENYRYKGQTFIYDKIKADVSMIWN